MKHLLSIVLAAFFAFAGFSHAQLSEDGATASFQGSLPPKPTADLSAEQQSMLERELAQVTAAFQAVKEHANAADVEIFIKAVRYALDFHEWYDKRADVSLNKARVLLLEARHRIEALRHDETPWVTESGQKVLGFYSAIDGSPQPYGIEIPEGLQLSKRHESAPMWIWLHGRGDTATDLNFIAGWLGAKRGQFQPANAIVIHPFGRFCNGWKSAGETDVMECMKDAMRFNVDSRRIALAGFSMGGAGAWHLGAHYAGLWAVVHTGAGFADVKRYQKLIPEKYPVWYEQKLWGVYDVPDYARNFLNVPLISYSGEIDAQRDSAEYMMEVLGKEGLRPPYLIGPGMPHKYHPDTLKELQGMIEKEVEKGKNPKPSKISVETKTLRYNKFVASKDRYVTIQKLVNHWDDARVDAEWMGEKEVRVTTKGVKAFDLGFPAGASIVIDGQIVRPWVDRDAPRWGKGEPRENDWAFSMGERGLWREVMLDAETAVDRGEVDQETDPTGKGRSPAGLNLPIRGFRKRPGIQGPIDDAFLTPFVFVIPPGKPGNSKVAQWARAEFEHAVTRWRSLMRGNPRIVNAGDLTEDDMHYGNVVLWGDPQSNVWIAKMLSKLPLKWDGKIVGIGGHEFPAESHVPVMIYPNPINPKHYIVLNSGLTFREAHDKTNSLQNPKLPDWAILDITQPPNAEAAGKVVAADFFDEHWQVKPNMPPVDSK